jgi:hypothetical protein
MVLSSFIGIGLNTSAQPENVWINGNVLNSQNGSAIAGATVYLQNTQDGTTNATGTNATGFYNVSIYAPPGGEVYLLSAFHEDYLTYSTYTWLAEGTNQTDVTIFLDPAANKNSSVRGTVRDAITMAPLPFTGLSALGENYINTTSTNATGNYEMYLESDQSYYIQVQRNGYESQGTMSYFNFGDNKVFDFLLEPTNCTLSGYVTNSSGPLDSASVLVYRINQMGQMEYRPQVNASGYFELNLSRGVWQVEVENGMHFTQTLTVLLVNGQTTWQNFTLMELPNESATISGWITYFENGTAAPDVEISSENKNGTWRQRDYSDPLGYYNISVFPGDITLNPRTWGYMGKRTSITTQDGGTYLLNMTVIDFWNQDGYLEGYVRFNAIGEPDVQVIASYDNWWSEAWTDGSGYYNMSVSGAPLEVYAVKDGFNASFAQVNTSASFTTTSDFDLGLIDWSTEIRGYVNNTKGDAVEGAYFSYDYDGPGRGSATGMTDYTGLYQMMAPSGYSSYFTMAEDHEYTTGDVNLPANQIFWNNETLTPVTTNAQIIFRFTNILTGKPIKNVEISIGEMDLDWFEDYETDKSGIFKADVPAGFVQVRFDARENGYKEQGMYRDPSTMQFRIKTSETRWLNISLFPRDRNSVYQGYVNDTGGSPIAGAKVSVRFGDTILSNTTDATGYYKIRMPGDTMFISWARAPGYKVQYYQEWIQDQGIVWYDWTLDNANAWIEGPITDSVEDLDTDSKYDFLYVNVTVNVANFGNYILEGSLSEGRNSNRGVASTEVTLGSTLGPQLVTLAFMGEQIRNSEVNGYYVDIRLRDDDTWETLDSTDHFTAKYRYNEFEVPDATIQIPADYWLVDTDIDGLFNYLIINATLNVTVPGDYTLMTPIRDIWGTEFDNTFETFSLEAGLQQVQLSIDGTSIYNNGETLGSIYMVLFEGFPTEGMDYVDTLYFYIPLKHDIFQFYVIDSYVSGIVTDLGGQPIEDMTVWLYNITFKYLDSTKTNSSGYYELGGWAGDWVLVVNDEDGMLEYQGDLTEITLTTGMTNYDFLNLPDSPLDQIETQLIFSDWNNTHMDWLLSAVGDSKTLRFEMDVLQFGNGDGFFSEDEAQMVMGMLGGMSLPDSSLNSFMVDGIWYDLNQPSMTVDAGLVGPITSTDPVYIHMTGDYIANSTIPDPSPHDLELNVTYDDVYSGAVTDSNATYIYNVTVPVDWGRTGNGVPMNVTISGSDFITIDPLNDPILADGNTSEWVNVTVSIGVTPTVGKIKGNVTLDGSGDHSGVVVSILVNTTQVEVASSPTNPGGYYEITGLSPGNYDVVAHKAGYYDNITYNIVLNAGDTLWFDFTLYSFPPIIIHNPVTSALLGDGINIVCDVTDDGEVDEVILYYMDVGSGSYSSIPMSLIPSTSTFMGTIPAQSQVGNAYYYIWANDTKGNSQTHPAAGNHSIFIYEVDPPEISNVMVSPDPVEYPEFVNISTIVTDDTMVEHVNMSLEMPDQSTVNRTMDYDSGSGRYYLNASYSQLGTYNYTIWAKDSFDNWNSSSGSFVVQDTISPTSSVDWISQYWYTSSPIAVDATASDSGIGVDFVELWYRYSSNNSTWGLWTLYQTDSASPYQYIFPFPDGEGYYEFFSIATDNAGNPETMKSSYETLVGYDATGPVSNVEVIDTYWRTSPLLIINATASETVSTIDNVTLWYRHSTNNASWGSWISFSADASAPYSWTFNFPNGEGFYEFFSIASDIVGNSESMKVAFETLCGYDMSSPSSNVDVIDTYWHGTSTISVNATATDTTSGVESVELWYRFSSDNSSWGLWISFGMDNTAPYQWTFDFPDSQGYYEFFSIANDSAGQIESVKISSEAICGYDTGRPTSSVQAITPYLRTSSPISLGVTASDTVSGVVSVDLWYRYSVDDTNWGLWTIYDTDTASPWTFSFDFSDGEGYYEFFSRATDLSGLTEGAPVSADTSCVLDSTIPAFLSAIVLEDPWELGVEYNLSIQISDVSGIDSAWMDINLGGTSVGNYSMAHLGQDYWYSYAPLDVGTLIIKVSAVDTNGLWNSVSYSTEVTDTTPPTISDFDISPSNPQVDSNVRVSVNVSDFADISSIRIEVTSPDDDLLFNESMIYDSQTGTYYHETDYTILGDYEIVIWAEDENGLGSIFTDTLTIRDSQPPSANGGPTQDVTLGTTVTLDAGSSTDNINITNYTWTFQENGLKRLYGKVVQYTFNTVKNYEINLTVWDESGNWDSDITWVNVSAVSGTGTINGIVRDEDGNPIQGATVYIEGFPSIDNTTDSLGRFSLENVPIGDQTIIVEKDGYEWTSQEVDVEQDQTTPAGNIELGKSVSGEEAPWMLFGAIIAIVVILVLILLLLLMQKKKAAAAGAVVDEVFFMYNDGRLIKHFTRRLKPDMDEDILGSMLVAVQDFVKDSFRDQEGILDEMKFGRFQVLLGRGKHIILATIVLGDEVEPFRPQIAKCIEDIEEKYGDVLEDWDGEMSSVRGAAKYIVDLIDGKYA